MHTRADNTAGSRATKDELFDGFARVAQAMANGRRAEILELLAQAERPVDSIAAAIDQSVANTSHHLHKLAAAGLVRSRREGTRVVYRLASDRVAQLWALLRSVAADHIADVEQLARAYLGDIGDVEAIDMSELARRLRDGETVVIDVRPRQEYEAGHITGARSIPLAELEQAIDTLPDDVEVIAYCRGPYCLYAHQAVRMLRDAGYRARRLKDGYPEWRIADLPVDTAAR